MTHQRPVPRAEAEAGPPMSPPDASTDRAGVGRPALGLAAAGSAGVLLFGQLIDPDTPLVSPDVAVPVLGLGWGVYHIAGDGGRGEHSAPSPAVHWFQLTLGAAVVLAAGLAAAVRFPGLPRDAFGAAYALFWLTVLAWGGGLAGRAAVRLRRGRPIDPWAAVQDRLARVGYHRLTEPQKVYLLARELDGAVRAGGFHRYLADDAGGHAREAAAALEVVGAVDRAAVVRRVVAVFGDGGPAADRNARLDQLADLPPEGDAELNRLAAAYVALPDARLARFAVMHDRHFAGRSEPP